MSRKPWSTEAKQRARIRRAERVLQKSGVAVSAPECVAKQGRDDDGVRGVVPAQPRFRYLRFKIANCSTDEHFNFLGEVGWEYVGLDAQGLQVFKRQL